VIGAGRRGLGRTGTAAAAQARARPTPGVVPRFVAGHRARARPRALPPGSTVGPAGNAVLLINPDSGGGTAARVGLVRLCRARGIEPVPLRPGQDLVALAEAAVAGGADVIGMAGGDGSLALVAGVAARHRIPMVIVPAGTATTSRWTWASIAAT
jgi:hypothetical protein